MSAKLAGGTAGHANWRAALTTAFCALLRGEFAVGDGDSFTPINLTLADLSFFQDKNGVMHCDHGPASQGKPGHGPSQSYSARAARFSTRFTS